MRPYSMLVSVAAIVASCGCTQPSAVMPDRFSGFYASSSGGVLELRREGNGYRGELAVDFGPFAVEAHAEGDVLRGTVDYAGKPHVLEIEHVADGVVVRMPENGRSHEIRLKKQVSKEAYLKNKELPDLGAKVTYEMIPDTRPTTRRSSSDTSAR